MTTLLLNPKFSIETINQHIYTSSHISILVVQLKLSVNLRVINTVKCFLAQVVQPVKAKKRKSVTFSDALVNGPETEKRSPQTSENGKTQDGDNLRKESEDDSLPVFRVSFVKVCLELQCLLQLLVKFSPGTRVKTYKLLQVCKQVVTNQFTSCQQVVFALLVPNLL